MLISPMQHAIHQEGQNGSSYFIFLYEYRLRKWEPMESAHLAETLDQTELRLRNVILQADLKMLDGLYCFEKITMEGYSPEALTVIRDEENWFQLVEASSGNTYAEHFKILSVHFQQGGLDPHGFIGWLFNLFKGKTGTDPFVICGRRSENESFIYWGCPKKNVKDMVSLLKELRNIK